MQMRGIIQCNSEQIFCFKQGICQYERSLGANDQFIQSKIDMVKLLRVYGGCLGVERRRRTWQAAISPGQVSSNR
jgi:hypothetical protein